MAFRNLREYFVLPAFFNAHLTNRNTRLGVYTLICMRGSRKFCQSGYNFDNVFFCMRGGTIKRPLKVCHHRPDSVTPFECWLGGFVIFQGIRTCIAKKPFIFVIFQGGGGGSGPPVPLWIRAWISNINMLFVFINSCFLATWLLYNYGYIVATE